MKVTVCCPVCAKESVVFPLYTEGKAKYPCGCEVSFYDKVGGVEYTPDGDLFEDNYEKLLNDVKKFNCKDPIEECLTSEEYEKCCDDAEEARLCFDDEIQIDEYDSVEHPFHYASMKYEPIDVSKEWTMDLRPFEAICVHNVLKYICRFHNKNGKEDLEKARWYLNKLIGEYDDGN